MSNLGELNKNEKYLLKKRERERSEKSDSSFKEKEKRVELKDIFDSYKKESSEKQFFSNENKNSKLMFISNSNKNLRQFKNIFESNSSKNKTLLEEVTFTKTKNNKYENSFLACSYASASDIMIDKSKDKNIYSSVSIKNSGGEFLRSFESNKDKIKNNYDQGLLQNTFDIKNHLDFESFAKNNFFNLPGDFSFYFDNNDQKNNKKINNNYLNNNNLIDSIFNSFPRTQHSLPIKKNFFVLNDQKKRKHPFHTIHSSNKEKKNDDKIISSVASNLNEKINKNFKIIKSNLYNKQEKVNRPKIFHIEKIYNKKEYEEAHGNNDLNENDNGDDKYKITLKKIKQIFMNSCLKLYNTLYNDDNITKITEDKIKDSNQKEEIKNEIIKLLQVKKISSSKMNFILQLSDDDKYRHHYFMFSPEAKHFCLDLINKNKLAFDVVMKMCKVPRKSLRRWYHVGCDRKKGCGRKTRNPQMESKLLDWYQSVQNKEINKQEFINKEDDKNKLNNITSKMIRNKAKEFCKDDEFVASKGWFEKFRKKFAIKTYEGKNNDNNNEKNDKNLTSENKDVKTLENDISKENPVKKKLFKSLSLLNTNINKINKQNNFKVIKFNKPIFKPEKTVKFLSKKSNSGMFQITKLTQ